MLISRPEVNADRVGAIGFCFPMPLELARLVQGCARLSVFTPVFLRTLHSQSLFDYSPHLGVYGAEDPFIPSAHRSQFESEMRAADADWQINLYGRAVHGFTNKDAANRNMPDAIRYSPEADAIRGSRCLSYLRNLLMRVMRCPHRTPS